MRVCLPFVSSFSEVEFISFVTIDRVSRSTILFLKHKLFQFQSLSNDLCTMSHRKRSYSDDNRELVNSNDNTQQQRVTTRRYGFVAGLIPQQKLLFVYHDEQLYVQKYKSKTSSMCLYICLEQTKCRAKAIINASGLCTLIGPSHTHPSMKETFHKLKVVEKRRSLIGNPEMSQQKLFQQQGWVWASWTHQVNHFTYFSCCVSSLFCSICQQTSTSNKSDEPEWVE